MKIRIAKHARWFLQNVHRKIADGTFTLLQHIHRRFAEEALGHARRGSRRNRFMPTRRACLATWRLSVSCSSPCASETCVCTASLSGRLSATTATTQALRQTPSFASETATGSPPKSNSAAVVAAPVARAVANALDALAALSAAVARCADTRNVRDVARITGLPRQTVHRWRTQPPAAARLAQVRDALRDASCG